MDIADRAGIAGLAIKYLTFRLVHEWFEKNESLIVGMTGMPGTCPLACYLQQITGHEYGVHVNYILYNGWTVPLQPWIVRFVRQLDETYPFSNVTGLQALELLDQIMADSHWFSPVPWQDVP